jgi:hypothetical protein
MDIGHSHRMRQHAEAALPYSRLYTTTALRRCRHYAIEMPGFHAAAIISQPGQPYAISVRMQPPKVSSRLITPHQPDYFRRRLPMIFTALRRVHCRRRHTPQPPLDTLFHAYAPELISRPATLRRLPTPFSDATLRHDVRDDAPLPPLLRRRF